MYLTQYFKVLPNPLLKNIKFQPLFIKTKFSTLNQLNWKNTNIYNQTKINSTTSYWSFKKNNNMIKIKPFQQKPFLRTYYKTNFPIYSSFWKNKNVMNKLFQRQLSVYRENMLVNLVNDIISKFSAIAVATIFGGGIMGFISTTLYLTVPICLYLAVDIFIYPYINRINRRKIKKRMAIGTRPEMDIPDNKFIPRPEIVECFEKIFQPHENQSNYHIIYGNRGNGKSTLAKKVANEIGQGVIYIDTPYDIEIFEKSFGSNKFALIFEDDVSFLFQLIKKLFGKY
jgi:hypothetical protein